MKRLLASATLFLCSLLTFAQFSGSGSGTQNDPYLILNPIQLNQMRNFLNQSGVYFKLMTDIDLTEFLEDENPTQGWQPVGSSSSAAFEGILIGNGKTISGLRINRTESDYVGLFGYTSGARISNLTIKGDIKGKNYVGAVAGYSSNTTFSGISFTGMVSGSSYVGGLVGQCLSSSLSSIVVSCKVDCGNLLGSAGNVGGVVGYAAISLSIRACQVNNSEIKGSNYGNDYNVGGVIGYAERNVTVSDCKLNDCIINASGYWYSHNVGGVIGHYKTNFNRFTLSLSSCFIHCDITGGIAVGGVLGMNDGGTNSLNNCCFTGNISGHQQVGGLIGYGKKSDYCETGSIQNCVAVGIIKATSDYAGGLIGYDEGYTTSKSDNISNCCFSGSVVGKQYTAGLVGHKKYGTISNCYASATISGENYVGGLTGYNDTETTIKSCAAINTRITATGANVGRIAGSNNGTLGAYGSMEENKAYNRTVVIRQGVAQVVTDNTQNGTGVSANTLKLKATYVAMGWDFNDSWAIQETECFPYMKYQTAPPVIQSSVEAQATTVSGKCVDGGTVYLDANGEKQQMTCTGNQFSFTVSPLQAGTTVRVYAKADDKEPSCYTTQVVSFLGEGTQEDPYQVYTAYDLAYVVYKGYYKLMNDIDLTSWINENSPTEGWISIGRDGCETIHFDGDGHKVTGLWCNSTRDNTGLFSSFANGEIKNLTVTTAAGKQVKGGNYTGILIGRMSSGSIENCNVSGTVEGETSVGGLVGDAYNCAITRCQASVSVSSSATSSYVGGLVGTYEMGTIDQCVTLGTLTATGSDSYVGGLVGRLQGGNTTITNSYSEATVTSSYSAAGLVAYNYGIVENCYASGDIYSNNYGAGVVGYNDGTSAVIRNCVAMNNKIEVTYESQQVQQGGGYGQRILAGIKNGAPAPEMNNYALKTMQVSVNGVAQKVYDDIMNGTSKEMAELKTKDPYVLLGWDFTDIWDIETGIAYPTLRNIGLPVVIPDNPDEPINEDDKNALQIDDVEANPGSQFVLPVNMVNEDEITAFQFDLYLPEGVTVAEDEDGELMIDITDRTTWRKHAISFRQQADGAIRVVCSSNSSATFTGNEGAVANITLNVSSDITENDYVIAIKHIELSAKNGVAYAPADAKATLSIISYLLGDADGNGNVSINDAVCIVNHILGNPNVTFVEKAADVDTNGTISINDKVVLINNYILGANPAAAKRRVPLAAVANEESYLYIENLTMELGETRQVEVKMQTDRTDIKALQCDIYLPQGVEFVYEEEGGELYYAEKGGRAARSHMVEAQLQEDGALRVVESSDNNDSFKQNDQAVFVITIRAVEDMLTGNYEIGMKNVELSYGQCINPDDSVSELIISGGNIPTMTAVATDTVGDFNVYNMHGQFVRRGRSTENLPKGVYIISGRKLLVK